MRAHVLALPLCALLLGACDPEAGNADQARHVVIPNDQIFAPDPRPASQRYVPTDISDDPGYVGFLERWFGGQLRAMGEPILSRPGDRQGFRRRFRLLVLPTFEPAYAFRVDQASDGTGRVRVVRLNGAGGYAPGEIAQQESYAWGAAEMEAGIRAVEASGLAETRRAPGDGAFDGTRFVFELIDDRGYHFADIPGSALSPPLENLVRQIDGLRRTVDTDGGFLSR